MALPENRLSTTPRPAGFLPPDDILKVPFQDWELGPIGLADTSEGLMYQTWQLVYDPDLFTFTLYEEDGTPHQITALDGIQDVQEVALAFDQNAHEFIAYYAGGISYYYWFDTDIVDFRTDQLEAGASSVRAGVDDKRPLDLADSDNILSYLVGGELRIRYEFESYDTVHVLATGLSGGGLNRVGMAKNLRYQWEGGMNSIYLADIVRQICWAVGVNELDTNELAGITVRGFMVADAYSAADSLRPLMRSYFFDIPEIDGQLYCKKRGADPVATILLSDMVQTHRVNFEDAREQEVEFAKTLNVKYRCAESDYTPTKETSERFSNTLQAQTAIDVDLPLNLEPNDMKAIAVMSHKVAWDEFEGRAKFGTGENFAKLTCADVVMVEVENAQLKRLRIERLFMSDGVIEIEAVKDRASSVVPENIVNPSLPPPAAPPPPNLPGLTTWEFMNLAALTSQHDTLHAYVAGWGPSEAWDGALLQRQEGVDWIDVGSINAYSKMGQTLESLPPHPEGLDTTNSLLVTLNRTIGIGSISDGEFNNNGNLALVGDELINFRDVSFEGGNTIRISHLNRGNYRTDSTAGQGTGSRFVMLDVAQRLFLETDELGQTFNMRAVSYGTDGADATIVPVTFTGQSQREWAPLNLAAAQSGDDWDISWDANPRIGWPSAPVPSVNFVGYRVKLSALSTIVELDVPPNQTTLTYTDIEQNNDFGQLVTAWDSVQVMGLNRFTGEGEVAQI